MKKLSQSQIQVSAPGKAILIGEHSAVYGFPALAVALPDIRLQLTLKAHPAGEAPRSWLSAFEFHVRGKPWDISTTHLETLYAALQMACDISESGIQLAEIEPQGIEVTSQIPLGAGMGGSAALSSAFVRLIDKVTQKSESTSLESLAFRTNKIDALFHGNASGLDAAAVAGNGVIQFEKGKGAEPVSFSKPFYLVLVDSGERSETLTMVEGVAQRRLQEQEKIDFALHSLGDLALQARDALVQGRLEDLGSYLNDAQVLLESLGVSTRRVEDISHKLRSVGALGAKLTGAGGGGMVLGLFDKNPGSIVLQLREYGEVYVTSLTPS